MNSNPVFLSPGDTDPSTTGVEDVLLDDPTNNQDNPSTSYVEGSLDAVKNDASAPLSLINKVPLNSDWTAIANAYDVDGSIDKYDFWIKDNSGDYVFAGTSSTGELQIDHTQFDLTQGTEYEMKVVATDNNQATTESTDTFFLNAIPEGKDDFVTTQEDITLNIDDSSLLANDFDPDGNILELSSISVQPQNGSLNFVNGTITYVPDNNFNGTDSFTYTISDGQGGTSSATVFITVTPVNDLPIAQDDLTITPEDVPVDIDVLANDSDVDIATNGDSISVSSVTQGANGSVSINPDGTVKYSPDLDFNGTDSFTYTVSVGLIQER